VFTGIVDHCGNIAKLETKLGALRIEIHSHFSDLALGESILVDGMCLTVNALVNNGFQCDLSPETLRVTTAGNWQIGAAINLERALRPFDRLSGHFVTGHVDQLAHLVERQDHQAFTVLHFNGIHPQHYSWLVKKGSITVNGVSLTVNEVSDEGFVVMLIPHTLQCTNLSQLSPGDAVNLEFDLLAKLVTNHLTQQAASC
jgi:riboflavin synthase